MMGSDPRLIEVPGQPPPYDSAAGTLYGKKTQFIDLDLACFSSPDVRRAFVLAMRKVEACEDQVDGFVQVGRQILVAGQGGDSHTAILMVCWECKWLVLGHRPDCSWQAVLDVSRR